MKTLYNKIQGFQVNGYQVYSTLNIILAVFTLLTVPVVLMFEVELPIILVGAAVALVFLAILIKRNLKMEDTKKIVLHTILQILLSCIIVLVVLIGWFLSMSVKMGKIQNREY